MIFTFQGGDKFVLILTEHLPIDTVEGYYAKFGSSVPVFLTKLNQVNLTGTVPGKFFSSIVYIFNHSPCNLQSFEHKIHHKLSLITTRDDFDSADPCSMQDACPI